MSAVTYFEKVTEALKHICDSQRKNMDNAAGMLADAIAQGRSIFSFGGYALLYRDRRTRLPNRRADAYQSDLPTRYEPVRSPDDSDLKARNELSGLGTELLAGSAAKDGDILILASTSGGMQWSIDMAIAARKKGIKVIGITALSYSGEDRADIRLARS